VLIRLPKLRRFCVLKYIQLGNTGEHPSHRYVVQRQIKLKPGTNYWLRVTPVGSPDFSRVSFTTAGDAVEPIEPSTEQPEQTLEPELETILTYEIFTDPDKGCEYIRILSVADTDYPRLAQVLQGEWTKRVSDDGVTGVGCFNARTSLVNRDEYQALLSELDDARERIETIENICLPGDGHAEEP